MAFDYDLFVIGGGSGGVRCARIAAGHGARVAIAEERYWGGTCVNVGCIPKKLMVQAGDYGAIAADSAAFGWRIETGPHDWPTLMQAKDREVARLNGVYVKLLSDAGVTLFEQRATFLDAHTLMVGDRRVTAGRIVVATGGHPEAGASIAGHEHAIVSDAAFHLPARPERVVIVGGGYIGVEFAGIFQAFGSTVDLVLRQQKPLRGFDEDLRDALCRAMEARGIAIHPGTGVARIEARADGSRVATLANGTVLEADLVFLAIGRRANTAGLGLEAAGIRTDDEGRIAIDADGETSTPGHYAIGDVSNRLNLTPVALAEGHHLADRLFGTGTPRSWDLGQVPKGVFFAPPIGSVGLTEAEAVAAAEKGAGPIDIYLTGFTPLRHTLTGRHAHKATMKLVVDAESDRVLGIHMMGDEAPEIVQGFAAALVAGITKRDLDRTVGIHPSSAEEFVTMRKPTRRVGG